MELERARARIVRWKCVLSRAVLISGEDPLSDAVAAIVTGRKSDALLSSSLSESKEGLFIAEPLGAGDDEETDLRYSRGGVARGKGLCRPINVGVTAPDLAPPRGASCDSEEPSRF